MAEVVDSIIAELILRSDQYQRGLETATATFRRFRAELEKPINDGGPAAFAEVAKKAAQGTAQAEEQATQKVTRTRKARSDAAKTSANVEIDAAKSSAAAVVASEKVKQDAVAETTRRRRPLEITSGVATQAAGLGNGRNLLQEQADARGATGRAAPNANPVNLEAETSAANKRAIAEAEINDRLIAQTALKAEILAADKSDAVAINDQLFALQQYGRYKALGLTETEAELRVETELLAIEEKRVRAAAEQAAIVEKQMQAQSGAIASKIGGGGLLIGGLVGGLGIDEISHLNDRYIELSNSLRVAGVNASEFDVVQQHLLATANKNGTNVNVLADVFRSASLGAHDLGASQADLLKLTDAASNALRIQGVSASKAQGSLLQLGHAFESGRVNAREFNSLALNLYPILQAAASGSDQFGGSVAKLRAAVVGGTVSSKDFFDAILKGSADLEERAGKATLTTEQGFTSLTNALVIYFGQADKTEGVSAALGLALQALGNNLAIIIPALAAIGTALTVGYIKKMALAAIATEGMGAAILGAFGGPVGLAVTAVTLALASFYVSAKQAQAAAKDAAEGLKALEDQYGKTGENALTADNANRTFGQNALGAIGHVNAFAGAVGNLADQYHRQAYEARAARIDSLKTQLDAVGKKRDDAQSQVIVDDKTAARSVRPGDFLGGLETVISGDYRAIANAAHGGYTDIDNRKAVSDYNRQYQDISNRIKKESNLKDNPLGANDLPEYSQAKPTDPKVVKALANYKDTLAGLEKLAGGATGAKLANINKQIKTTKDRITDLEATGSIGATNAANRGGRGRAGPSADTLTKRAEAAREKGVREDEAYNAAHKSGHDKELAAELSLSDNVAARAELERDRLRADGEEQAKNIRLKGPKDASKNGGVAGTGEYTAAQTADLLGINHRADVSSADKINQDERLRNSSDARSIEAANVEIQKQHLEAEQGLADTVVKRRDLAKQLLDLEYQEKAKALAAIAASDSSATPAERTIAQNQLNALPGQKIDAQNALDRTNQGAGRAYADSLSKDRGEAIQDTEVTVLKGFNSELDKSIEKSLKLHGIFGSIVGDLIDMVVKQALIKPIANALFPSSGGTAATTTSGGLGGIFGGIGKLLGIGGSGFDSAAAQSGVGAGLSFDPSAGLAALPGLATGGTIGGNGGVDRNVLSLNGVPQARVGKGELLSISPNGMSPNARAAVAKGGDTIIQQNIQYSGAVDIASRSYVEQIALAQHAATKQAIDQGNRQTLAAAPNYAQQRGLLDK